MDGSKSTSRSRGGNPNNRVTLAQVAVEAGVSKSQASKALNNSYGVDPNTRERVVAAAQELGFVPNELARSLTTGRSETVGLLTSDLEGRRFALPIMLGAEAALHDDAATILLSNTRGRSEIELRRATALLSRHVDALLLVGDRSDPRDPLEIEMSVPVVYAYAPSTRATDTSVAPDDFGGGRLVAEHLIERGRTRIGFVGGDATYAASRERIDGVTRALAAVGLELVNVPTQSGWDDDAGWRETQDLLASGVSFDALVCASDTVGRGALDALHAAGLSVPGEVALAAFDNLDLVSPTTRPSMTSIDLNLPMIGAIAVQKMFALQAGESVEGVELVPCTLVVRSSS